MSDLMKKDVEARRLQILFKYEMQNGWMRWGLDKMMVTDMGWSKVLYQYSDRLFKFVVNARLETLPSPDNLQRWGRHGEFQCGLCGKRKATAGHILAGCTWVRTVENKLPTREDRYTWRHNCVLLVLANAIKAKLAQINAAPIRKPTMKRFVKLGAAVAKSQDVREPEFGQLDGARDWECDFDLPEWHKEGSKFVFPHDVLVSELRIDGYILSRSKRICIFGPELTVPLEERIEHWHSTKQAKYAAERVHLREWSASDLVLEVGSRGWIPHSFRRDLRHLGFSPQEVKELASKCSSVAVRCSYVIWVNRFNQDFKTFRILA